MSKLKEKKMETEKKSNSMLYGGIAVVILVIVIGFMVMNNNPAPTGNDGRPFKGNIDAKVVVIEYSDFQCPACGSAYNYAKNTINEFQDEVRFEYRHFPLTSIHPYAFKAAVAAEAAGDQGKFWEYHDKLFENQDNLKKEDLIKYAEELELDIEKFTATLEGTAKDSVVNKDIQEGISKGVNSTPSFFVNGKKIGKWSNLKQAIQTELNK